MIIQTKSHLCVLFTTVLFISTPLLSTAAQIANAKQEAKVDFAELAKTVEAEAKRDIKTDLDAGQRMLWFLGGIGCGILTVGAAAIMDSQPPIHRLLGKSPEYITIYTTTYAKEVRKVRLALASAGCLTTSVFYYLLVATDGFSGNSGGYSSSGDCLDLDLFGPSSSGSECSGCN